MRNHIGVVDVGVGNVGSLCRSLADLDVSVTLVTGPAALSSVDGIVLPGVGSFDHGVNSIKQAGLWEPIKKAVIEDELPILGICLGMQLLGNGSEEGSERGLGLIPGDIKHISTLGDLSGQVTIPNMGWCRVEGFSDKGRSFLDSYTGKQRYYFVHSYYFHAANQSNVLFSIEGVPEVTAAIGLRHVSGFQFHPEKSHRFGKGALDAWVRGAL